MDIKDFGAVGDGVTDDSQAFIDWIQSGNRRLEASVGSYYIPTARATISENVFVDARGAVFKGDDSSGNTVTVGGVGHFEWHGGAFTEIDTVFYFGSGSHGASVIHDVRCYSCERFIYDAGPTAISDSESFVVERCLVKECSGGVMYRAENSEMIVIRNNRFIDITHPTEPVTAISVGNDNVGENRGVVIVEGNYISNVSSGHLSADTHGIQVHGENARILNNYLEGISNAGTPVKTSNAEGIYTKSRYAVIQGNTLINAGDGESSIRAKGNETGNTAGHSVTMCQNHVVRTDGLLPRCAMSAKSSRANIFGNTIEGYSIGVIAAANGHRVTDNVISYVDGGPMPTPANAVVVYGSSQVHVADNFVNTNSGWVVY